jgi:2-amino-4-hydroxy-6-hydroxymethyldihydropteridine diphosphokinase
MPRVFVAAGSNIDAERNLALGLTELKRAFPDAVISPAYRNRAVGFEGEDFINAVAGFTTELSVLEVLATLHRIEALCGRPRDAPKWAPRTMDLDILLYGDRVCAEPGLRLPRPDLLKRSYVLGPLADIAPEVVHPTDGRTIGELWARFDRDAHALARVPLALPADASSAVDGEHLPRDVRGVGREK